MELKKAKLIAEKYLNILKPFTEWIEIVSSIYREKPEIKNIEIVAIPKIVGIPDFLGISSITTVYSALDEFISRQDWTLAQDGMEYKQILLPEGIKLDLFIANKDNWENIYKRVWGNKKRDLYGEER